MIDTIELCNHIYDEPNELTEDQKDVAWCLVCESMDLEDEVNQEVFFLELDMESAEDCKAVIGFFKKEGVI